MAFTFADLTADAHTRIWEHFNGFKAAILAYVGMTSQSATLASGWEGQVRWIRTGQVVSVQIGVRRTAANSTVSAWNSVAIATGLPTPVITSVPGALAPQWGAVQSNLSENSTTMYAFGMSGSSVNLQARWTDRWLGNNTWFSGTFTYHTSD